MTPMIRTSIDEEGAAPKRQARTSVTHTGPQGIYTMKADGQDTEHFKPSAKGASSWAADKDRLWTIGIESDYITLVHNAIRAEVTKFEALLYQLGDRELKPWEREAVKEWWKGHHTTVAAHINNMDNNFHPFVHARVSLTDEFEKSHEELKALLHTLDTAICNRVWKKASEIAPLWHGYRTALYPHLVEEENIVIPLMRAYFEPAEVQAKITAIIKSTPKLAVGSIIHHLAGGKDGVMTFMARQGYAWHAWYTEVHATRTMYREQMESKIESLLRGEPDLVLSHKADFAMTRALKPLALDSDLVRRPSNARAIAGRIVSEHSTGRLSQTVDPADLPGPRAAEGRGYYGHAVEAA